MLNKYNKSQITIFIIVGIILVLVSFYLFYNSDIQIFSNHDSKIKSQIKDVVENCIEISTKNGAFLLGSQAGFIDLNKPEFKNPFNIIDLGFKIPIWDSTKPNGIPTINSMENQLNEYVSKESKSCILDGFKQLSNNFNIKIKGNLSLNTTINPKNIIVQISMPIKFNQINSPENLTITDYHVKLDNIPLGDLYSLAVSIYNQEVKTNFAENLVIDQIFSASDYSNTLTSMPSEGMSFSCSPKYWIIDNLKKTLSYLNNANFKYLQFEGTYSKKDLIKNTFNDKIAPSKYSNYYKKFYTIKLNDLKKSFKNYDVNIIMPSVQETGKSSYFKRYPFRKFKITPSNGQIVKSQQLKLDFSGGKIPIPCIQIYHYLYNLDYDLIVTLTDKSNLNSDYFFRFPLRVLIINNNPKSNIQTPITIKKSLATNEKFCSNQSRKYPMTIYVTDKNNPNLFLNDVNLTYKCINLECDLGSTHKREFRGYKIQRSKSFLKTKFPFCINGKIIAEKEGYHRTEFKTPKDPFEYKSDQTRVYNIEMIKVKKFKLTRNNFLLINYKDTSIQKRINPSSGESIYVSLENKNKKFSEFAIYPSENLFDQIKLLEGDFKYNISIVYVDKDGNLKGIYENENVLLNPLNGNYLNFNIPYFDKSLDLIDGTNFYQILQNTKLSSRFGIKII